eukprot:1157689-Pelagomonas_calceolata.AAC.9
MVQALQCVVDDDQEGQLNKFWGQSDDTVGGFSSTSHFTLSAGLLLLPLSLALKIYIQANAPALTH